MIIDEMTVIVASAKLRATEAAAASVVAADVSKKLLELADQFARIAGEVEAAIAKLEAIDAQLDTAADVIAGG